MNASPSYKQPVRAPSGFTLIEVLIVVVILSILAGLIVPRIMSRPEEARKVKARMQIESLEAALKLFKLDNGFYPDTEQGLKALVEKPATGRIPTQWREGGYLEKGRVPKDPWGYDFIYISPGVQSRDFDLMSLGADHEVGGTGPDADITNWDASEPSS
jgi:general secretion pathway protein G